jgi:hypothetical protein
MSARVGRAPASCPSRLARGLDATTWKVIPSDNHTIPVADEGRVSHRKPGRPGRGLQGGSSCPPQFLHHGRSRLSAASQSASANFMEWFDFAVYGFSSVVVGEQFFGGGSAVVAVLSALAVFAVGFLRRPLGGFVPGPIGDRFGRGTASTASVVGMGPAGFVPPLQAIGVWAALPLVLSRRIQGLSIGGERTGPASFLLESASARHRGLPASIVSGTAAPATLIGGDLRVDLEPDDRARVIVPGTSGCSAIPRHQRPPLGARVPDRRAEPKPAIPQGTRGVGGTNRHHDQRSADQLMTHC